MELLDPPDGRRLGWDAAPLPNSPTRSSVSSPAALDDLGRRVAFCHRERLVTPWRLVLSLLASHATGPVETLADMQRQFHALFGTTVAYKPFHNQLAWCYADQTPKCPNVFRMHSLRSSRKQASQKSVIPAKLVPAKAGSGNPGAFGG